MYPFQSMEFIERAADKTLGVRKNKDVQRVRKANFGFMIAGQKYESEDPTETDSQPTEQWSKLIGILACPPHSPIAKNEIIPGLNYFHERSNRFVDIFCIGYLPSTTVGARGEVVQKVNGDDWIYDDSAFNFCRQELESKTNWEFSGESDLLLTVARKKPDQPTSIDYSCSISCNLEEMLRDKSITSVRSFFEIIFRAGEKYTGPDPASFLSDPYGLRVAGKLFQDWILELLPSSAAGSYKAGQHFAVKDISCQNKKP